MSVLRIIFLDILQVGGFTIGFGAVIALALHLYEQSRDKAFGPLSDDWTRNRFIDRIALKVGLVAAVILVIILNHVMSPSKT